MVSCSSGTTSRSATWYPAASSRSATTGPLPSGRSPRKLLSLTVTTAA